MSDKYTIIYKKGMESNTDTGTKAQMERVKKKLISEGWQVKWVDKGEVKK